MEIPIELDHAGRQSLQCQLYEQFRRLILTGHLRPGAPVPASRALAEQLSVSRNTVLLAYDRLVAEGYLQAREATGTYVSFELPENCLAAMRRRGAGSAASDVARGTPIPFQGQAQAVVNAHRLAWDFWLGRPDPHSFPIKIWRRLVNKALARAGSRFTEYREPGGLAELREAIAAHLGAARGIRVTPEQVIVTAGSQEGLNLAARLLVRAGSRVATENPCYQGAAFLFESYGAELVPVPVDENGIDVDRLPRDGVALLYVTPSHQYPMGFTLSLERRIRLLDWACRCGAYIIEDDYDSDFRYRGSPLTALAGLDKYGCVIYLGTFSKSIGAGLRIGYLVVPPALAGAARTAKALLDNGHPWLEQAVMADFIRSGSYANHLRRIRHLYGERRDCLVEALRRHFGDVRLSGLDSGMHLAWHLAEDLPAASELQELALAEDVGIYSLGSGAAYDFGVCAYSARAVVLGYSSLNEGQIEEGIERIARAVARRQVSAATPMRAETFAGTKTSEEDGRGEDGPGPNYTARLIRRSPRMPRAPGSVIS